MDSNTDEKQAKPGQFTKGDPRINRKGRPKSFDQLRALAQQIAHERIAEGSTVTAAEAILRKLAHDNPERFIEIAFGKVPDVQQHEGKVKIQVEYVNDTTSETAHGTADDQSTGTAL
jgi:hypothetical protein